MEAGKLKTTLMMLIPQSEIRVPQPGEEEAAHNE
jgi:hypothetical protein